MKKFAISGLFVFLLGWSVLGLGAEWQIGVARTDITPRERLWLAGYGNRTRPADAIAGPLAAKALLIEDGQESRVVIVTIDLIGDNFPRRLTEAIAEQVRQLTGIERERILFNFSHTHAGPVESVTDGALVTYGLDAGQQAAVNRYTQVLQSKLVALIAEAAEVFRKSRRLGRCGSEESCWFAMAVPFA